MDLVLFLYQCSACASTPQQYWTLYLYSYPLIRLRSLLLPRLWNFFQGLPRRDSRFRSNPLPGLSVRLDCLAAALPSGHIFTSPGGVKRFAALFCLVATSHPFHPQTLSGCFLLLLLRPNETERRQKLRWRATSDRDSKLTYQGKKREKLPSKVTLIAVFTSKSQSDVYSTSHIKTYKSPILLLSFLSFIHFFWHLPTTISSSLFTMREILIGGRNLWMSNSLPLHSRLIRIYWTKRQDVKKIQ